MTVSSHLILRNKAKGFKKCWYILSSILLERRPLVKRHQTSWDNLKVTVVNWERGKLDWSDTMTYEICEWENLRQHEKVEKCNENQRQRTFPSFLFTRFCADCCNWAQLLCGKETLHIRFGVQVVIRQVKAGAAWSLHRRAERMLEETNSPYNAGKVLLSFLF